MIDINTADSSLFERQRGIGPSLANRIIKYRERLGGFVSAEQIREIWNFPDSTYQSLKDKFVANEIALKKSNLMPMILKRYASILISITLSQRFLWLTKRAWKF